MQDCPGSEFHYVQVPDQTPIIAEPAHVARLSVCAATITMTQNIMGAGVLALPYTMKSAGLGGGLVLLVLVYILTVFSKMMLVLLAAQVNEFSFHALARQTLGGWWPIVLEVWVLCYTTGICTSLPIVLGDCLHQLAKAMGAGIWSTQRLWMTFVVACVCWPLSCAEALGHLKVVSALGLAGISFTVVAVVKRYNDGSYEVPGQQHLDVLNPDTFGRCLPILVCALSAHFNLPRLFLEVAPHSDQSENWAASDAGKNACKMMRCVVWYSVTICTLTYGVVGVTVYATFGSHTNPDFTENFHSRDPWIMVVRVTLSIAICAVFPLTLVSTRTSLFNLIVQFWNTHCTRNDSHNSSQLRRMPAMSRTVRFAMSTAITGLCFILAVCAGNIGVVLAYNGTVFGIPVCYIAPVAMYLRLPRCKQSIPLSICCILCGLLGVTFGVLGFIEVFTRRLHEE